jgi:hypothetical protein
MANLQNLPRRKKPSFLTSVGNKVKTAFEYGMAAKGLFDMGKGIYQGVSTYGPMLYNAAKAIGPTAATVAAIL